jgi:hypothetical protein
MVRTILPAPNSSASHVEIGANIMKSHQDNFTLRASVLAVRGALITLAMVASAQAADNAAATAQAAVGSTTTAEAPAQPTEAGPPQMVRSSTMDIGLSYVSKGSFKAGEYTGLQDKGVTIDANIGLYGGAPDSAERWSVTGTDLGLETRNIQIEAGVQGKMRFNFGYDELLRNRSDSYQTPYLGAGSNNLTLPGTWVQPVVPALSATTVNARGLSSDVTNAQALPTSGGTSGHMQTPSAGQITTATSVQNADLPDFHNVDLSTKRQKYDAGLSFNIDPQWDVQASVRHELKDGLKPMGSVSRANAEISTVIPDLIDQQTDQFNASLGYTGDKSFMKLAYYGSIFKNNVSSMSWADWSTAGGGTKLTMSSAPSNEFHQFSLTGGYNYTPTTKVVMKGSYARNTQNESFVTDSTDFFVPGTSLHGLVITKNLDLKLTSRPTSDLNLSAAYKYNDRDNRTPVNVYGFTDAQNPVGGTSAAPNSAFAAAMNLLYPGLSPISFTGNTSGNFNLNANRPYSKKLNTLNLDADYRVAAGQTVAGGIDWQKTDNYCDGTWISCWDAAKIDEKTYKAEWRANVHEDINGRIAYEYSKRKVDYNEDAFLALVPMANVTPTGAPAGVGSAYDTLLALGLSGYGPISGILPVASDPGLLYYFANNNALSNSLYANANRISELVGMRRYNMADRNRDKLRTSANWQANEKLALQAGLNYNKDDYANSEYGLQNAKNWTLNLEGDYAVTDTFSVSAYFTHEDQKSGSAGNSYTANSTASAVNGFTNISVPAGYTCSTTIAARNAINKVDPCTNWTADQQDKVNTVGLSFQNKDMMAGKLALAGNLSFSRAKTDISATGGNYVNNPLAVAGAPAGTVAAYYIPAQDMPTVTTNIIDLRLNSFYQLDKQSSLRLGYAYQYMKAKDWAYDGMQIGGLAGALPTNEQAPSYKVHTIAVGYVHTFQ